MHTNKILEILEWLFTPVESDYSYRFHTGYDLFY